MDRSADMSYASYEGYCKSLEMPSPAELSKEEGRADVTMEEAKEPAKTTPRPIRNRMLQTHWPPANVKELHLERW